MTKKYLRRCIMLTAALLSLNALSMEFSEEKTTEENGTYKLVKAGNKFFDAVFTSCGGRLKSLIDKKTGEELLTWGMSRGGALDDKNFMTTASYTFKLESKTEDKIEMSFTFRDEGVSYEIEKRITLYSDLPVIKANYKIKNVSNEPLLYAFQVRNFFIFEPEKDSLAFYFYNTPQGIEKKEWGYWAKPGNPRTNWANNMIKPWLGVVDAKSGSGIVSSCSSWEKALLWCQCGRPKGKKYGFRKPRATVEWIFPAQNIAPGASYECSGSIALSSGMKNLCLANSDLIMDLDTEATDGGFGIKNRLLALSESFQGGKTLELVSKLMDMKRKPLERKTAKLKLDTNGKLSVNTEDFKLPAGKPYILKQKIVSGKKLLGEYETPLPFGKKNPYTLGYRHPDYPPVRKLNQLQLSNSDLERGYFIHYPVPENHVKKSLDKVELTLGHELEFVELDIENFRELGNVEIKLAEKNKFPGKAEIYIESSDKYQLLKGNTIIPAAGKRNAVWLKLDLRNIRVEKREDYNFKLEFRPQKSKPCVLNVQINALPLDVPLEDSEVYISQFHTGYSFLLRHMYPEVKNATERLHLWGKCLDGMKETGANTVDLLCPYKDYLDEFVKVKEFKDGYLPVLDLSNWKPMRMAGERGFRHAIIRYSWLPASARPDAYASFSHEKKMEVRAFAIKQFCDELKKNGFDRIFYYLIDELGEEEVPKVCSEMSFLKKAIPCLEFAGSGFGMTSLNAMRKLAEHLSMIEPYWGCYQIIRWIKGGKIKTLPDTALGTQIEGWGPDAYSDIRGRIWNFWKSGLNDYQIYKFCTIYKDRRMSCVVPTKDGFEFTVPGVGYIDAAEDFRYLWKLKKLISELEKSGESSKVKNARQEIEQIIGKDSSILQYQIVSRNSNIFPEISPVGDETLRDVKAKIIKLIISLEK